MICKNTVKHKNKNMEKVLVTVGIGGDYNTWIAQLSLSVLQKGERDEKNIRANVARVTKGFTTSW